MRRNSDRCSLLGAHSGFPDLRKPSRAPKSPCSVGPQNLLEQAEAFTVCRSLADAFVLEARTLRFQIPQPLKLQVGLESSHLDSQLAQPPTAGGTTTYQTQPVSLVT